MPQLLAIHAAHPTETAWQLTNRLAGQYGVNTPVARVRALLDQHDQQAAA